MVVPTSKFYTGFTVLFHRNGGENVVVTNFLSHFSMFVPTKATVKLDNGKTGHAQGIGIILCHFLTVPLYLQWYQFIIFLVTLPTPSHQVLSYFMLAFKGLLLNLFNIVNLFTPMVVLRYHLTRLKKVLTIFKSKLAKSTLDVTG